MNKKVVLQIGCFLTMFILEIIAVYDDPSSVLFNVLLILAVLMIPAFVIVGRAPIATENVTSVNDPIAEAA